MGKMAQKPQATIVILDDDPIYLRLWEKIFENIPNCQYYLSRSSQEALDLIDHLEVNLIVSDIVLPGKSGYDIATHAQQKSPTTSVILTTGYSCDLTRFKLKNPHFHILYKPYKEIQQIQKFIKRILANKDLYDEVSDESFSENETYNSVTEWKL